MRKKKRNDKLELPKDPAVHLAKITRPLLELFAEVDTVFSYEDAFTHKNKSLGRIYRKWKEVRKQMDPSFDQHKFARKRYEDRRQ